MVGITAKHCRPPTSLHGTQPGRLKWHLYCHKNFKSQHRSLMGRQCYTDFGDTFDFQPEDGGNTFLRNVVKHLQDLTASQPRIPQSKLPWIVFVSSLFRLSFVHPILRLRERFQKFFLRRTQANGVPVPSFPGTGITNTPPSPTKFWVTLCILEPSLRELHCIYLHGLLSSVLECHLLSHLMCFGAKCQSVKKCVAESMILRREVQVVRR
jgi:hypothetical protein